MYPLVLNDSGTWVMHFRGRRGCCVSNIEKGPQIVECLTPQLTALFGHVVALRINAEVSGKRHALIEVSGDLSRQWHYELELKKARRIPQPRRDWKFDD